MKWDLSAYYKSFTDPKYKEDYDNILKEVKDLKAFITDNLDDKKKVLLQYVDKANLIENYAARLYGYVSLNLSENVNNKEALTEKSKLIAIGREFTELNVVYTKFLKSIDDINKIIDEDDALKEYKFILNEGCEQAKHSLSDDVEIAVARIKETGSYEWNRLHSNLTSKVTSKVEFPNGEVKEINLPAIRNLQYEDDKELRRKSFAAEEECYDKIRDSVAMSLSSIKGEVINECELRGYESPLEKTLIDSRFDKEILDAMWSSVRKYLPDFVKYFNRKAKLLGYDKLPYYETFAPVGKGSITYTFDEAKDFVIKQYYSFSDKLGDFAKHAFENNWLDTEPREGKVGGAFCSSCSAIKESRVLANFGGTFDSMITFAHELGHAYHGRVIFQEEPINQDYTMPIAETASIFAETITYNAALKDAKNDDEKIFILENIISGAAQTVVDIYSRFLFEDEVFRRRKDGALDADDFDEIMMNAQKEAFKDGLDPEKLNKGMWICKSHYYSSSLGYYNFPYCFGLLFARGLYSIYKNEGDAFIEKYDTLLRNTGKMSIKDCCKSVGIDVTKEEFFDASLETIKAEIDEFLKLTE